MILVNDVKLSTLPNTDPFVKHYKECLKGLEKRFGKSIIIDHPIEAVTFTEMGGGKKRREYPASKEFSTKQIYMLGGNQYELQYATTFTPGRGKNDLGHYIPKSYDFRGRKSISLVKDPDLAFFLVFVSPYCGLLMDKKLAENQNRLRGIRRHYVVFDETGVAEEELSTTSKVSEASALISSEKLGIPLDLVYSIGSVYGIFTPKAYPTPALARKQLADHVLQRDTRGKYDMALINKFVDDVNIPEMIKLKQLVKELISYEVVAPHRIDKQMKFVVLDETGKATSEICNVNKFEVAEKSLLAYLQDHESDTRDLKELLEIRKKAVVPA